MPMPELLAAIDQITSACKDISIHDKADAFSKESFPENQGFSVRNSSLYSLSCGYGC